MGIWVKVTQDLSLLCLITKGIDNDFKINSLIKKKKEAEVTVDLQLLSLPLVLISVLLDYLYAGLCTHFLL